MQLSNVPCAALRLPPLPLKLGCETIIRHPITRPFGKLTSGLNVSPLFFYLAGGAGPPVHIWVSFGPSADTAASSWHSEERVVFFLHKSADHNGLGGDLEFELK